MNFKLFSIRDEFSRVNEILSIDAKNIDYEIIFYYFFMRSKILKLNVMHA
jgi:hypothetical protein